MHDGKWVVAQTNIGRENWAAENVVRQGGEFYLPRIAEVKRVGKRSIASIKPLFPRYLFVFVPGGRWHYLLNTFGVSDVIRTGLDPAFVPATEIERLRDREDALGLIRLLPPGQTRLSRFCQGEQVRITEGVFSGLHGVYQGLSGRERADVLLHYLGAARKVRIDEHLLEAV